MMPTDRFERHLPELLDELAEPRTPDYFDDLLWQTANTSQRPAWSFLERWLPMVDIARQPVLVPRMPRRAIGLGLVLLALLVAMVAALVAGGRQKLPAPFGPTRNGLVAYASGGDVFTVNAVTGNSTAIVKGPGDTNPRWSRDGTQLAFERQGVVMGPGLLFVARADGSHLVQVTPDPLSSIASYSFSPNGKEILISATISGVPSILIAATDGTGIHQLDVGGPATNAAWRPPDGSEILFMDAGDDSNGWGTIHAVNVESGKVRTILARADAAGRHRGHPAWSPDGTLISYGEWVDFGPDGLSVLTHIITADGTGDRILPIPTDAVWQAPFSWSNDGTRLLAIRGYTGGYEQTRPVAVPVAGSGSGIEIQYPGAINLPGEAWETWEWSPDDTSILGTPVDSSGGFLDQVLLDPVAGTSRTLPWQSISQPSGSALLPEPSCPAAASFRRRGLTPPRRSHRDAARRSR
jgi:Tol biopolymer transport system component